MTTNSGHEKDVFDELYEVLFAEDQEKAKEKIRARRIKLPVDHVTYNFLENEQMRLKTLDQLLTKKISNWENHEQITPLTLRAHDVLFSIKEELSKKLAEKNSFARENCARVFDRAFS